MAEAAQSPAQGASATAAALRAMGRLGGDLTAATARARATAAALDDQAMLRAEVLAALWETDGHRTADAAAFGAALAAYADAAPDAHDRRVRREGFARRFLVAVALTE